MVGDYETKILLIEIYAFTERLDASTGSTGRMVSYKNFGIILLQLESSCKMQDQAAQRKTRHIAVLRVFDIRDSTLLPPQHSTTTRSETTTTATTLATGRVRWCWCDIFDSSNLHAGTSQSTESGLCAWAWGLCAVAWMILVCCSSCPVHSYVPPVALILIWRAVIPNSLHRAATS